MADTTAPDPVASLLQLPEWQRHTQRMLAAQRRLTPDMEPDDFYASLIGLLGERQRVTRQFRAEVERLLGPHTATYAPTGRFAHEPGASLLQHVWQGELAAARREWESEGIDFGKNHKEFVGACVELAADSTFTAATDILTAVSGEPDIEDVVDAAIGRLDRQDFDTGLDKNPLIYACVATAVGNDSLLEHVGHNGPVRDAVVQVLLDRNFVPETPHDEPVATLRAMRDSDSVASAWCLVLRALVRAEPWALRSHAAFGHGSYVLKLARAVAKQGAPHDAAFAAALAVHGSPATLDDYDRTIVLPRVGALILHGAGRTFLRRYGAIISLWVAGNPVAATDEIATLTGGSPGPLLDVLHEAVVASNPVAPADRRAVVMHALDRYVQGVQNEPRLTSAGLDALYRWGLAEADLRYRGAHPWWWQEWDAAQAEAATASTAFARRLATEAAQQPLLLAEQGARERTEAELLEKITAGWHTALAALDAELADWAAAAEHAGVEPVGIGIDDDHTDATDSESGSDGEGSPWQQYGLPGANSNMLARSRSESTPWTARANRTTKGRCGSSTDVPGANTTGPVAGRGRARSRTRRRPATTARV